MARAIWKGGISFGLVYVPVQVYPATTTQHTGFNLLEKHSIDPIGYKQVNKRTGKEVTRENIVRGFEYEKGRYVVLTDEEIQAASPESTQSVDILSFVDAAEVSFFYLDTPYYLAPERRGEKTYEPSGTRQGTRAVSARASMRPPCGRRSRNWRRAKRSRCRSRAQPHGRALGEARTRRRVQLFAVDERRHRASGVVYQPAPRQARARDRA